MSVNCTKCGQVVKFWEKHKRIGNEVYCEKCLNESNEEKTSFTKIKKFFEFKKEKLLITISLYIIMLIISLFFYKPLLTGYSGIIEIIAQIGFVINFPIVVLSNSLNINDVTTLIILDLVSLIGVIFFNYLLACELYLLYTSLIKK